MRSFAHRFARAIVLVAVALQPQTPTRAQNTDETPSEAELQKQMMKRMGIGPAPERVRSADGVEVVLQAGHSGAITAVALSADGRFVVSGGMDGAVKVWEVASGKETRTLARSGIGWPLAVALSPGGQRIAVAEMTSVELFDFASGRTAREADLSTSALVSADGRILAEVDEDGDGVRVSETESGRTVAKLAVGVGSELKALSPDGGALVTWVDKTDWKRGFGKPIVSLELWDVRAKTRRVVPAPEGFDGTMGKLAVSPAGQWLALETRAREIVLIDLAGGTTLPRLATGGSWQNGWTNTLAFAPDGKSLAWSPGYQGAGRVWAIPSGEPRGVFDASAISFSADSKTLVMGRAAGGAPLLRDLASGRETPLVGGATELAAVAFADGGRTVAAAMHDGSVKLWELATGSLLRSFPCPAGESAMSVAANGSRVAFGCEDGSAWLADLASAEAPLPILPPAAEDYAYALVGFAPDGRRLIIAVRDRLALYDVAARRLLRALHLPAPEAPRSSGPDTQYPPAFEQMIPKAYRDQVREGVAEQARQDEADRDPEAEAREALAQQWVKAFAIHPDGRRVAIGRENDASIWDIEEGRLLLALRRAPPATQPFASQLSGSDPLAALGSLSAMGGWDADAMREMMAGAVQNAMHASGGDGASSLAFSPDGSLLVTLPRQGRRIWDVATGAEIVAQRAAQPNKLDPTGMMDVLGEMETGMASTLAVSPDGRLAARDVGNQVLLFDVESQAELARLSGHTSEVSALAFSPDGRSLVSGGRDGSLRVWSVAERKELVALMALGGDDFVAVTPDQFYRASKRSLRGVAFRYQDRLFPFEQFDLRFNRPDVVLERIGLAAADEIAIHRSAYQRRLAKLGFREGDLGSSLRLPRVEIVSQEVPVSTESFELALRVRAEDDAVALDRLLVSVNEVPVFGAAGLPIVDRAARSVEQTARVPLAPGRNKIQVSVLNQQGAESLRQTVYTNAIGAPPIPDVFVIAVGVSKYKNSAYDLQFAAKDAEDVAAAYQGAAPRPVASGRVHVLSLTDARATREAIRDAKRWLEPARTHDLVIVFAAGHGMTDARSNYFFGTHDIDPDDPGARGLPFEDFEALLDGIRPLRKVLLVDTCFSGEIEKNEPIVLAATAGARGNVKMRSFEASRGMEVKADATGEAAAPSAAALLRFQREWFADLRRGTGAIVISSSSGDEYSFEGEQWRNGVFTYALLQGLRGGADANHDGTVTIGELQGHVIERVRDLTAGGQNPTVRRENLEFDFPVQ